MRDHGCSGGVCATAPDSVAQEMNRHAATLFQEAERMDHFHRSLIRILLMTFFLLFIAWLALKLMQNGNDIEGLIAEGRRTVERWIHDVPSMFDDIAGFLKTLPAKISVAFNNAIAGIKRIFS